MVMVPPTCLILQITCPSLFSGPHKLSSLTEQQLGLFDATAESWSMQQTNLTIEQSQWLGT
jgi:hypothetical protein